MKNSENKFDSFRDGMLIFLSYINRKQKKDPNYVPHPLIRAFECAIQAIGKINLGECVAGISGENKNEKIHCPYIVVLEKQADGLEVKTIRDINTDKELPIDVMLAIFRIQICLDRIEGHTVTPEEMVAVLNNTIPGMHFYALGNRWKEARDKFTERVKQGKIHLPASFKDSGIIEELLSICQDTPWEEYPQRARSLIGAQAAELLDLRHGTIVITAPPGSKIEKYSVFETATEFLMGDISKYFQSKDCIFCDANSITTLILAVENSFVILADKYPLLKGHILVISKEHRKAIGDFGVEELIELSGIINKIASFYASLGEKFVMFEPGVTIQDRCHAHIHFLPGDFLISEALKSMGLCLSELNKAEDVVEFYKKNGRYLFWCQESKFFACALKSAQEVKSHFFRALIAGQLMNSSLINWRDYEKKQNLVEKSELNITRLKDEWREWELNDTVS